MRRSRPLVASLIGLGFGVAGCDTVTTASIAGTEPRSPMPVLPHDVAVLIFGLSLATLALIVASIIRRAIAHDRLADRLRRASRPAVIEGRQVALVPGQRVALVAGLRRPRTFISSDVVDLLSDVELAAVVASPTGWSACGLRSRSTPTPTHWLQAQAGRQSPSRSSS